jgi:hypothetical protein
MVYSSGRTLRLERIESPSERLSRLVRAGQFANDKNRRHTSTTPMDIEGAERAGANVPAPVQSRAFDDALAATGSYQRIRYRASIYIVCPVSA